MKKTLFAAFLAAFLVTANPSPSKAQEEAQSEPGPVERLDAAFPEVPPDLWADFKTAFEKEELFAFGQALKVDVVKKELEDFERRTVLKSEIVERDFLSLCDGAYVFSRGRTLRLRLNQHRPVEGVVVRFFCLECRGPSDSQSGRFRIPEALLEPFRFQVVSELRFTHPIHSARMEAFSAQNESLALVFYRVLDAFNPGWKKDPSLTVALSEKAHSERVTLTSFGLTVFEVLDSAAAAAGFTVSVNGSPGEGDFRLFWYLRASDFLRRRESRSYSEFVAAYPKEGEAVAVAGANPYTGMLKEELRRIEKEFATKKYRIVLARSPN